jgi:hypothetical protein
VPTATDSSVTHCATITLVATLFSNGPVGEECPVRPRRAENQSQRETAPRRRRIVGVVEREDATTASGTNRKRRTPRRSAAVDLPTTDRTPGQRRNEERLITSPEALPVSPRARARRSPVEDHASSRESPNAAPCSQIEARDELRVRCLLL